MTSRIARFKQATGMSDREIATLTGRARSTVQAVIAGKLPDTVTAAQLLPTITERAALLDALKQECQSAPLNHGDTDQ
jgi:transcriptional regulator with XRE-family HTH domain